MAEIRDTAYIDMDGVFTRVDLIDCGFFHWEVALFKCYTKANTWNFYKLDEHGCEEHARENFKKYKEQEENNFISEFTVGRFTTRICKSPNNGFDAIVTDNRFKKDFKRTQENMTAEETIRYLANAANRR